MLQLTIRQCLLAVFGKRKEINQMPLHFDCLCCKHIIVFQKTWNFPENPLGGFLESADGPHGAPMGPPGDPLGSLLSQGETLLKGGILEWSRAESGRGEGEDLGSLGISEGSG